MLVGGLIVVVVALATGITGLVHTRRVREEQGWTGTRTRGWTPETLATLAVDDRDDGLGPDDAVAVDAVVEPVVVGPAPSLT